MPDDNPEVELTKDEPTPEIDRLIQSQLGKAIDLDTGKSWSPDYQRLLEITGLGNESFRKSYNPDDYNIPFVEQYVNDIAERYPGILLELGKTAKSMAQERNRGLLYAVLPFQVIQRLEDPAQFGHKSRIKGGGILIQVELDDNDWQEACSIALEFPEKLKEQVPHEVEKIEKMLQQVDQVITEYKKGHKPTTEDCLQGRSITEPILQFLVGGTPEEGLSSIVLHLGSSFSLGIGTHKMGKPGLEVPAALCVQVGSTEVMHDASQVAKDYLSFISRIMQQNPEIKTGKHREPGKLENVVSRYLDLEWQQKDEAVDIAKNIRVVLQKKIEFYQSLLK